MLLHDPPGGCSSATWSAGREFSASLSLDRNGKDGTSASINANAGFDATVTEKTVMAPLGIGVSGGGPVSQVYFFRSAHLSR